MEEATNEQDNTEDFTEDDFKSNFLKMPAVGAETGFFTMTKFSKNFEIKRKDKDGNSYECKLSGVDYSAQITTSDDRTLDINNWEVFGKVKNALMIFADKEKVSFTELAKSGKVSLNIKHIYGGMIGKSPAKDIAKLNDITIEQAQKMIDDSNTAKKEKRLYEVLVQYKGECYEITSDRKLIKLP